VEKLGLRWRLLAEAPRHSGGQVRDLRRVLPEHEFRPDAAGEESEGIRMTSAELRAEGLNARVRETPQPEPPIRCGCGGDCHERVPRLLRMIRGLLDLIREEKPDAR
jgi:hypothetical protein